MKRDKYLRVAERAGIVARKVKNMTRKAIPTNGQSRVQRVGQFCPMASVKDGICISLTEESQSESGSGLSMHVQLL